MNLIDFILNLAGLLLWINWRSLPFDPFAKRVPATLVGTLRRAAPSHFRRWHLLAFILALLLLRAVIYWWLGSSVWAGHLDLGVTVLAFRNDWFVRILVFSCVSFGLTLGIFYLCLLLLSLLGGSSPGGEPIHRLVRMQLGGMDGWPAWAKLVSPFAVMALCWWLASWLFARLQVIPQPLSAIHRVEEAFVVGLVGYLVWKFVAAALLVLHLLNTYIYFGKHPFWNYVNATAQTLLVPLRKIPLRAGRVDFTPVIGIAIIFFATELVERGLILLYVRLPF